MAGQLIVLPGVTAAASAGAPRINMNAPDLIAAKNATLKHVVSARSLALVAGGGVSGRCRATGAPLIAKGISASTLALYEIAGRKGLGINGIGRAGLALPANSLTESFTTVSAVNIDSVDIAGIDAGTSSVNFLSGFDASDVYRNMMLRYASSANADPLIADKLRVSTTTSGTLAAPAARPTGNWIIVITDYNNTTRLLSISANQVATFASTTQAASLAPAAGSYLEIGYHPDASSLRASKVGDLYTFSDSLLRTELGKSQLADLVGALKTYYSIA